MVSDGANGAILVWRDHRNGQLLPATFAQRITATGVATWTLDGVDVKPVTSAGEEEHAASTRTGLPPVRRAVFPSN